MKINAIRAFITIDAIIKALIALIFIKIIPRLSSCQISEEIVLWLKRLSPTENNMEKIIRRQHIPKSNLAAKICPR